ncbi:MAG: PAS domain S-box protein [Bacteroidales bacterium]
MKNLTTDLLKELDELRTENQKNSRLLNAQHDLLQNVGLAIITTSADGVVKSFNTAAEKMLGYSAAEVIGRASADIFHDHAELEKEGAGLSSLRRSDIYPGFESLVNTLKKNAVSTMEWFFTTKDGTRFPVKLTISCIEDADGVVDSYILVAYDLGKEKQVMKSLRESEERFHSMFHNHDAVMLLVHPDSGIIVEANDAAEKFYGYKFKEAGKISIYSINTLPDAALRKEMSDAMVQRRNYFIFPHRLASGEVRIVEVHSSPIKVNNQKLLFSIIHDITERRKTEELLKRSETENRAIFNAVPDLLFRLDRKGIFLDSRSGDPKNLLIPVEHFLGKNLRDVLPPVVATLAVNALEKAFSTRETVTFEYELQFGEKIHFYEDRVVAISDNEVLSIVREITERKKAELALQWNESLLQKMTSTSPLAFLVVDNRDDAILYFNHRFCEIWGITHLEEQMRKGELKNNDIIPDCLPVLKDIPAFAESCTPLQDEFNQVVLEDEIPFSDGRMIRRFSAQIRGEKDEYFGRLYIFEDITQRKATEQFIRIQRDLAAKHSTIISMHEALSIALEVLLQIDGVDCGGIYLHNAATGCLDLMTQQGLSDDFISKNSHFLADTDQSLIVKEGNPLYVSNETLNSAVPSDFINEGILSLAVLPMKHEGEIIGCINLASKRNTDVFSKVHFSLEALAGQIGGTIARINAETSLKQSQKNFQALFDTLDDFMFILDAEGRIIRTNPVVQKRLGYTDEQLYMKHVLEVHPPARREEAGFIVGEMLANRALFCPVPLITRDGVEIPVETRVVLGKWDDKDVLFGISRDVTERVKAEKELQVRESYLSAVIRNHPGMFWMKDVEGKFLLMNDRNDAFLKMSGMKNLESVIGSSDFDFMPVKNAVAYKEEDEEVMRTREPLVREEQGWIDSAETWFEKYKFPVVNNMGEVIGVSAYSIDITERKKAESALKIQSSAFESFALPIVITDANGLITWSNTSFLKLTGYSEPEIIGKTNGELVKSGTHDKEFYKAFWKTLRGGKVWSGELMNRKKDGTLYPEELTITPVFDQEQKINSYIAISIDLTEKKVMERALRESEARWNFALEGSGDGVWDWNIVSNQVFFSRQWKFMLGFGENELSGTADEWRQLIHPDDKHELYANLEKHFRGETEVYINEHRTLCKDGSYKWVLDRGKVVSRTPEGDPARIIGTCTDITDRKFLEQTLREGIEREKELNELKSKFVSVASHEFKTPLATILATSESLLAYGERMTREQQNLRLGKIKDQVTNLNKIIEEVLYLSKLQAREVALKPEQFDIIELFSEIVEGFRTITGSSLRFTFTSEEDSIQVVLDQKQVTQILTNLLMNAVKYSGAEDEVTVEVIRDKDRVFTKVTDHGIGIPEEDVKHLFKPFYRASNAGNISGTGLGLNIVKESLNRHGGSIIVESILNEGTAFTFELPIFIQDENQTEP